MEGWVVAYMLSGSLEKAGQVSGESWSKNQRSPGSPERDSPFSVRLSLVGSRHWEHGLGTNALDGFLSTERLKPLVSYTP